MSDPGFCPDHNVPWKVVPAGVSRRTGKAFGAFLTCPVQGCPRRPEQAAIVPTVPAQRPLPQESMPLTSPAQPPVKADYSARDRLSAMQTAIRCAVDIELQLANAEQRLVSELEVKRRAIRFYERILLPAQAGQPFPDLFDEGKP